MKIQQHAITIGLTIFFLILLSVIATVGAFWGFLPAKERAIVGISGIGALGTAALALATFWTLKQNNETLKDLEREREKPVILDLLAQVIDPIIENLESNDRTLSRGHHIWSINSQGSRLGRVAISQPPDHRHMDVAVWSEFEENYSSLYSKCDKWYNLVGELNEAAEELAESLYRTEEYDNISDDKKAVRTAMNTYKESERRVESVDGVEEYRLTMYRCYPEKFHHYWRAQWNLLKFTQKMLPETIEMKRNLKKKYGISHREIEEQEEAY